MLRKEMDTKIAMLENQLEAERRRNKLDFSNLDDKIRSEYAKRWFLIGILSCHIPCENRSYYEWLDQQIANFAKKNLWKTEKHFVGSG